MRDFIGAYGRVAGIGGAAGFLLSLLVGLFSGNPLGTIFLRALLFALLFGGFGVGARVVLGRFLPEIAGVSAAGNEAPRKKVDIVLPEENPHADSPGVRVTEPRGASEDGLAEAEALAESGRSGPDGDAETASSDLPPPGPEDEAEAVDDAAEAPEVAEPAAVPRETGRPQGPEPLPTLDSLGGSPGGSPGIAPGRGARASRSPANTGAMGNLGGEDPALIARAIRTVLKKDEKG